MNDEQRLAIAAEVAAMLEPSQIEDGEFTIADYVALIKAQGGDVSYNTVAGRLKRAVRDGLLTKRHVQGDRSSQVWAFRRVEPCED